MSLRSFYVTLSLLCCLQQIVTASPPMNIRKLYESSNGNRAKKEDLTLLPTDEDVLELEELKEKPIQNDQITVDDIEPITNPEDILPTLQKQLELEKAKTTISLGQPEEEEQISIPHRPHHPTTSIHHEAPHRHEDIPANMEKLPSKPFYGAARLTYGQNPETKLTSTTTSSSTTEHIDITTQSTTSTTTSSPAVTEQDSKSEEWVSAELEATKNGERRSVDIKSPKVAESVLKHPDGQYSSFDMAQYVFWTGDEAGVAKAVEEFIQEGLMSRENAIKFLRDIRIGIEYLQNSYANRIFPDHLKIGSQKKAESSKTPATLISTLTTDKPYESEGSSLNPTFSTNIRKTLEGMPSLLRLQEATNDHNKENSIEYDEMSGRMRLADFLYAEYSLEEVIYQLAKVMFSQSLTHGSEQAQRALQRLTGFLETEGEHGRISPALQKKILDVLLAALSDTLSEHPELMASARAGLGNAFHKLPKHILEPIKN